MKIFRTFFIGLTAFALLLPLSSASAMTAQGGEEFILPEDVTVDDDLYIGAGNAVVNGAVNGDLFVAGGNVTVANRVDHDLMAAGGNVTISADVGDDLRVVGGNVSIFKRVGDDLIAGGGTVHILKDAIVEGDLTVGGGLVIVDGVVNGNVQIAGGEVAINGDVNGTVNVVSEDTFKIGPGATIVGRVTHSGYREAEVDQNAQVAQGIEFTKLERPSGKVDREKAKMFGSTLAGFLGVAFIIQILMFMVTALVAVYVFKKFSKKLIDTAMKDVGTNMLRGFGFLILMPIVLIIVAGTVLGLPLAAIGAFTYALMIALAKAYAGVLLGAWIFKLASKERVDLDWKVAVIGVLALEILVLIPFVGWIASFLVFCAVLGAIYTGSAKRLKEAR